MRYPESLQDVSALHRGSQPKRLPKLHQDAIRLAARGSGIGRRLAVSEEWQYPRSLRMPSETLTQEPCSHSLLASVCSFQESW